jgi:hypothetical protein
MKLVLRIKNTVVKFSRMLRRLLWRSWMLTRVRRGWVPSLNSAANLWALTNRIYLGPVGPRARILPEFLIYEFFCSDTQTSDNEVFRYLLDSVAGYAFEILLKRQSPLLVQALQCLKSRSEIVSLAFGCSVCEHSLAQYVANRAANEKRTE